MTEDGCKELKLFLDNACGYYFDENPYNIVIMCSNYVCRSLTTRNLKQKFQDVIDDDDIKIDQIKYMQIIEKYSCSVWMFDDPKKIETFIRELTK